jgi:hypothetical protein
MIVVVRDGSVELYSYDTEHKTEGLSPAQADFDDVRDALREALAYLGDDDG